MSSFPKVSTYLTAAIVIINGNIEDALRVLTVAVIDHKGDSHVIAQVHIVLVAEADDHDPIHIPHGRKLNDLLRVFRLLYHHKLPVCLDFR